MDVSHSGREPWQKEPAMRWLLLGAVVFFSAGGVRGDIWLMTELERPPLPLPRALDTAEKRLQADGVPIQYCSGSMLSAWGDWSLTFVTRDGRTFDVRVPVKGEVTCEERGSLPWNDAAPPPLTAPKTLAEVKKRIEQWAAAELPGVKVDSGADGSLTVTYRPRKFLVHPRLEGGGFADGLREMVGPKPDGLVVRIAETDSADWLSRFAWFESSGNQYYWHSERGIGYLAESGKYVTVEWRTCMDDRFIVSWFYLRPPSPADPPLSHLTLALQRILGPVCEWDWRNRPPIPLSKALKIARAALGKEADSRYCFRFELWGDQRGDRRYECWQLFYPAEDGTQKIVAVTMDGKAAVAAGKVGDDLLQEKQVMGPGLKRICGIEEARQRLKTLFENHGLEVPIRVKDNTLTASYHTRTYQVYPLLKRPDKYAEPLFGPAMREVPGKKLVERVGPKADGFWLEIAYEKAPTDPWSLMGGFGDPTPGFDIPDPYWHTSLATVVTMDKRQKASLELRIGKGEKTTIPAHEFYSTLLTDPPPPKPGEPVYMGIGPW